MEKIIDHKYLREHPNEIFVFGDNLDRRGLGGAAKLRYMPNAYGFVTKKRPTHHIYDYFTIEEYKPIFEIELRKLISKIEANPTITFLISKIGAGLANKYYIFEDVIHPGLKPLLKYKNVQFLFDYP